MELKSNELRIGNLVQSKENRPFEITLEDLNFIESGSTYKPIQLTEEWILKFGFEGDLVWSDYILHLPHERMLGIVLKDNHIFLSQWSNVVESKSTKLFFRDTFMLKCKYVHQLQNLFFALTGEELKLIH